MTDETSKPKKAAAKMVEIENAMKAGKLFTSQGICMPGERIKVPTKEAKMYCAPQVIKSKHPDTGKVVETVRPAKARVPFPDDE